MRYREGDIPENIGPLVADETLLFTAVLGLLIGIGLVIAAVRGKQIWLTVWGSGLVVCSLVYTGYILFG